MVDQVWIWIIRQEGHADKVITSFPNRTGANSAAVDDLQKLILADVDRDSFYTTQDLVAQVLAVCCHTLNADQDVESVKFLQFFESSIGHIVSPSAATQSTNDSTDFFMIGRERRPNTFVSSAPCRICYRTWMTATPEYQKRRRPLLTELLNIGKESKQLTEVKDILDEVKIIQAVLEDQEEVLVSGGGLDKLAAEFGSSHVLLGNSFTKAIEDHLKAKKSFLAMKSRAEDVETSVSLRFIQHSDLSLTYELARAPFGSQAEASQSVGSPSISRRRRRNSQSRKCRIHWRKTARTRRWTENRHCLSLQLSPLSL